MCSNEDLWPPDNHVMYHRTTCTAADMLFIVVTFDVFLLPAMQPGADFVVDNIIASVADTAAGPMSPVQYPALMSPPLTTATSPPQGSTGYSTRVARLLHYQQPAYYFHVKNLQIHVTVFVLCFTYLRMTFRQQQDKQLLVPSTALLPVRGSMLGACCHTCPTPRLSRAWYSNDVFRLTQDQWIATLSLLQPASCISVRTLLIHITVCVMLIIHSQQQQHHNQVVSTIALCCCHQRRRVADNAAALRTAAAAPIIIDTSMLALMTKVVHVTTFKCMQ